MYFLEALSKLPVAAYIPLLLVFAATVALLGSLSGVGGGVLHIPVMVWVLATTFDIKEIKFISTFLVFASALINLFIGIKNKKISYLVLLYAFSAAVPAVFLGNFINNIITKAWITEVIIVVLLIYVTIQLIINQYVLKKKNVSQKIDQKWYHIKLKNNNKLVNVFYLCIISFFAGIVTSLTGMGGGVILMPFLILVIKLNIKDSAPISHSIIFITSLLTIIIESTLGETNYFTDSLAMKNILVPMLAGAIIGTVITIFVKKYIKKETIILWILISLIWISIIRMTYEIVIQLT